MRAVTQDSTAMQTCLLAVVNRVALELGLKQEVQSVERAMRECLVINKVKSVRIVMWDSTVRRTMKSQLLVSHVLQDMYSAPKAKRPAYPAFLESTRT